MDDDRGVNAGIQHVALEIERDQAERAREFWRLVGFEQVSPPVALRQRAIWMEAGPAAARAQIHLLYAEPGATEAQLRPGIERLGDAARRSACHVAIVVLDFEATVAALRRAGFTVRDRRPHWGAARAFAGHPGGHTIELMASPPAPG